MTHYSILVIGAGIGGLSAAIALRRTGHTVTLVERDADWSVYGVGIIPQSNVVRAMDQLGVLDAFLDAAFGFDAVEIFAPDGTKVVRVPSPRLVEGEASKCKYRATCTPEGAGGQCEGAGNRDPAGANGRIDQRRWWQGTHRLLGRFKWHLRPRDRCRWDLFAYPLANFA